MPKGFSDEGAAWEPSSWHPQHWSHQSIADGQLNQGVSEDDTDYMDLDDEEFQLELNTQIEQLRQEKDYSLGEWNKSLTSRHDGGGTDDVTYTALEIINHSEVERDTLDAVIVVDTNYLISHLKFVSQLVHALSPATPLMIPTVVIRELDGLKSRRSQTSNGVGSSATLGEQARKAIDFLYRALLQKNPSLRGQKLEDRIPGVD
ncbi:hypothetical protein HDU67_008731, partial [Dinochytrium kinnereticum]